MKRYSSDDSKRMRLYVVQWRGKTIGEVYLLPEKVKREGTPPKRFKRGRERE